MKTKRKKVKQKFTPSPAMKIYAAPKHGWTALGNNGYHREPVLSPADSMHI